MRGAIPQALQRAIEALRRPGRLLSQGLSGAARGYVLAELSARLGCRLLCVTAHEEDADLLAADLAFFFGGAGTLKVPHVLRLPVDEVLPFDEVSPDAALASERLGALYHLRMGTSAYAAVVSIRALLRKVIPPQLVSGLSQTLRAGQEHGRDDLARQLVDMGYQSVPLVEDVGTFSVRGDILDVFSPLYPKPVRLEFFGDTLESMRAFDAENQRTVEAATELSLPPAREFFLTEKTRSRAQAAARAAAERLNLPTSLLREQLERLSESTHPLGFEGLWPGLFEGGLCALLDYLPFWGERTLIYWDDGVAIERAAIELERDIRESFETAEQRKDLSLPPEQHFLSWQQLLPRLDDFAVFEGGGLSLSRPDAPAVSFPFGSTQDLRQAILSHHGEEGALTPLVERLSRHREMGVATAIACGTPGQSDRIKRLLLERNLGVRVHPAPPREVKKLFDPAIHAHLFAAEVSSGFVDSEGGFALLSDEEIFGGRSRRRAKQRRTENPFTAAFRELKEGELIVHTDFGIGRYLGLTKMEVRGIPGDFLVLEYAGRDKIYLPVSRMRLIQKFTGGDPTRVALDKLGTPSWEKTKKRVKEALLKMAAELLQIYAARKAHPGFAFSAPDRYFHQFEADFEFEETVDQAKAIEDVLSDMQKAEPMDRLVCGDVGYGKTEVAMRAAFKAVLDKKQVAVLVPTTVLAQQHFQTFRRRFGDYPMTVEVVSRMRKPQENRDALARAKAGRVDILIGTHKLLGSDVAFKDLGLLIVDEEQRFGVKHKEQLKRLRTQVDVLTLTATPIPRTLNMAMSGVRDMSIIATPPQDRRAIRTFVMKFDPAQIKEAIEREVQRGGQVFFVHNRVQSIHSMERLIRELCPSVKLGIAHGQMGEGALEKVMTEFVDKKIQLLLCTSIIESGIDISSANTMIVNRADNFGLAQLYQLRGRVGRSKERAYAYLLIPARRTLTKDAQRRLEVLQAFTELGAGFSIASHDLEIRGAGNLLGEDQSGAIAEIGFDLYTQLLEEAVSEMRGEPPSLHIEPEIHLPLAALIPDDYVPDVHQRLLFYKRFSVAQNPEELADLRAELVDRFGELPDEVDHLSELTLLKMELRALRCRALEAGPGRLVVTLGPDALLDGGKLAQRVARSGGVYRLTPDLKLVAKLRETTGTGFLTESKKVLRDLEGCAREA